MAACTWSVCGEHPIIIASKRRLVPFCYHATAAPLTRRVHIRLGEVPQTSPGYGPDQTQFSSGIPPRGLAVTGDAARLSKVLNPGAQGPRRRGVSRGAQGLVNMHMWCRIVCVICTHEVLFQV